MGGSKKRIVPKQELINMYSIEIDVDAKVELIEIVEWYNQQKFELGFDFLDEIENIFTYFIENPNIYAKFANNFHRANCNRFPYSIIYTILEDDKVVFVVGIFHQHRSPKHIGQRIKDKSKIRKN